MSESKVLALLRRLVTQSLEPTRYHAAYRYRVVRMASARVELQLVSRAVGLPDVLPVSLQPGVPGCVADLANGSIVLVMFVEGDPAQPVVTHFSRPDDPSYIPVNLGIDATGELTLGASAASVEIASPLATQGVARVGDSVGPFVITTGSTKVRAG